LLLVLVTHAQSMLPDITCLALDHEFTFFID
jgi:hypothetical protein